MSGLAEKCWAQAWEDVKEGLGPVLKKARISTDPASWSSLDEITAFAEKTRSEQFVCYDRKGRKLSKFTSFIRAIHKSAPALDLFVQQQPFVAALAWGTVRFLVQVFIAEIEVGELLGAALIEILPHLQCWNSEAQIFSALPTVRQALHSLFGGLIVFLVHARVHVESCKATRWFRSAFSTKFQDLLQSIESSTRVLNHSLRDAFLQTNASEQSKQEVFRKAFPDHFHRLERRLEDTLLAARNDLRTMSMYANGVDDNAKQDADLADITNWLGKGVFAAEDVPQPASGTCKWIFQNPTWASWKAGNSERLFWLTGMPGCGKSVLARSLENDLKQPHRIVLRFSFGGTTGGYMKSAEAFAVATLWNLFQSDSITKHQGFRSILRTFTPLRNRHCEISECSVRSLLPLLHAVLDLANDSILIVDALDECSQRKSELVKFLSKLGRSTRVRVVVFSRDHLLAEDSLQGVAHLPIDATHTEPDILKFIDSFIEETPELENLRVQIRHAILHECRGIFLWAWLMLEDLKDSRLVGEQKKKMANFPTDLPNTYTRLLETNGSGLSVAEEEARDQIFLILLAANRPMCAEVVYDLLLLDIHSGTFDEDCRHVTPAEEIIRLCKPMVRVARGGILQIIHATATEYLKQQYVKEQESDLYLARKCLGILSRDTYRQWKTPASLLRRHLFAGTMYANGSEGTYKPSVLYNYAVEHFQEHVTALSAPPEDVLAKLSRFLRGTEFVTWSEVLCDLTLHSDLGAQVLVYKSLYTWTKFLPPYLRVEVPIEDFFEVSHQLLSEILHAKSEDRLLQYLPSVRVGQYYNTSGQARAEWQKAYEYKLSVVEGVADILGPRSPVTLRFKTSMLQEYFWQKRFDDAYRELAEVAAAQREVVGGEVADLFHTLQLLAYTLVCMTRFAESLPIFDETIAGQERLLGSKSPMLLGTRWLKALALEQLGRLEDASAIFSDILDTWTPIGGTVDPLSLMVSTAYGSVLRKQRKYAAAEKTLLESYGGRKQLFSINNNVCLDTAVQLALLYRDEGKGETAIELLESVSDSLVYKEDFERLCLTQHIRALIMLDTDNYRGARRSLSDLLNQATGDNRALNNRELLWARLTLATAMRQHGDDADGVPMLFDGLVEPVRAGSAQSSMSTSSNGLKDEPESRHQLRVAEAALVLVRQAKQAEAAELLEGNQLQWVRDKDFWVLGQGGPIPDTAVIRPIAPAGGRGEVQGSIVHGVAGAAAFAS